MRDDPALGDGHLPSGNSFEHRQALLEQLVSLDIDEVSAGQAVLGNEDWLLVPFEIRQELGGLSLEGGDGFGAHLK